MPTTSGNSLELSYYTPATVQATHRTEHAGKYELALDLVAESRYVDNQFDLNRSRLSVTIDGKTVYDEEFRREGGKKFDPVFECDWAAGDHKITLEVTPLSPGVQQIRSLSFRVNTLVVRGPLGKNHWVRPKGYSTFFPRPVPAGSDGRHAYAREILGGFALRAFRRPLDDGTLDRLVTIAEGFYSSAKSTFEAGIAHAMVAVLSSPRFIFREETSEPLQPGQKYPFVDEYALASRLSYFLWSSMPDEELLRLAGTRQLRAQLPAQLRRLLADSRSDGLVRNFTGQWLQARDIATVPIIPLEVYLRDHPNPAYEQARKVNEHLRAKPPAERTDAEAAEFAEARKIIGGFNRTAKPELTDTLRRAMQQETEMVFGYVLREDRSMLELLKSDYTFLNETLAQHYGIHGVTGSAMRKVTLPPDSPRGGVLTQGTVLAVTSNPTRTSPVKRGVFILEAILGAPPPPPPPDIPSLEDAASAEELRGLTLRETMALHPKKSSCASCHSRMDPLGLALENFNALGAWRMSESGQPVRPAGQLITGEKFSDIRELKDVLTTSRRRDYYYSLADKLLTYALGRGLEYYDTVTLDRLVTSLEESGGKPSALLEGIVSSAPFQQRREPEGNPLPGSLTQNPTRKPWFGLNL